MTGLNNIYLRRKQLADSFEEDIRHEMAGDRGDHQGLADDSDEKYFQLDPEGRADKHLTIVTAAALSNGIATLFSSVANRVQNGIRLAALPRALARDYYYGSNTLMRALASKEVTEDRLLLLTHLRKDVFSQYTQVPTLQETSRLLNRLHDSPNFTIGECYWLCELCQWLGCAEAHHPTYVTRVLGDDLTKIDFRAELDMTDDNHVGLRRLTHEQYETLTRLLIAL